jgi:hypothetical protein
MKNEISEKKLTREEGKKTNKQIRKTVRLGEKNHTARHGTWSRASGARMI